MKANELKTDDVIEINFGAMNPPVYALVHGIEGDRAICANIETMAVLFVDKDENYKSVNGSGIGSWKKLSDERANFVLFN